MGLLPNKVYWCSQSEDDSEEGFYVGNIVSARETCVLAGRPGFTCPRFPRQSASNYACCCWLSWVGCLSVQFQRLRQGFPCQPTLHLLDLSCGRPSLGAPYASPPGKAIPSSVTWHQVTRHTPSNARHFLGPRHYCHSAHPPIMCLQVPMVTS
ncbi:uncharacterized protein LOC144141007 isoform X3 [Haemaphysalis longicornis]